MQACPPLSFLCSSGLLVLALAFAVPGAACSGSSTGGVANDAGSTAPTEPTETPDAGGTTNAPVDAGPPAEACSTLEQAGASIAVKGAKPPVPEATGGTPADGTYVLTSVKAFSSALGDGASVGTFGAWTIVISAGGTAFEQVVSEANGKVSVAKGAFEVKGKSFSGMPTCEEPLPEGGLQGMSGKISSSASSFNMYLLVQGVTAELVFTKK